MEDRRFYVSQGLGGEDFLSIGVGVHQNGGAGNTEYLLQQFLCRAVTQETALVDDDGMINEVFRFGDQVPPEVLYFSARAV